jgi:predicted ATPase
LVATPFVRSVVLKRDEVPDFGSYPFSIPAVRELEQLELHPEVTLLAGENGSGKSTLAEAIAVAAGFNAEGGSQNMRVSTRASHSQLHKHLRLVRGTRRPRTGYFLRAESFFNVATNIEELDEGPGGPPLIDSYGGVSLHEQSHGESFLSLILNRFGPNGLYVLDEPEAALSLRGNLALMRRMHDLVAEGSQFVVSTHSPILLGYPQARIYVLSEDGIEESRYEDTEQYELTRSFLDDRDVSCTTSSLTINGAPRLEDIAKLRTQTAPVICSDPRVVDLVTRAAGCCPDRSGRLLPGSRLVVHCECRLLREVRHARAPRDGANALANPEPNINRSGEAVTRCSPFDRNARDRGARSLRSGRLGRQRERDDESKRGEGKARSSSLAGGRLAHRLIAL